MANILGFNIWNIWQIKHTYYSIIFVANLWPGQKVLVTKNTNAEANAWASTRSAARISSKRAQWPQRLIIQPVMRMQNSAHVVNHCPWRYMVSLENASTVIPRSAWCTSRWLMTQANWLVFIRGPTPVSVGSPHGSHVIDDSNYHVTAHFKNPDLYSTWLWLICCTYKYTFSLVCCNLSVLSDVTAVLPRPAIFTVSHRLFLCMCAGSLRFHLYFNWRLLDWMYVSLHGLSFSSLSLRKSLWFQIHWFREISAERALQFYSENLEGFWCHWQLEMKIMFSCVTHIIQSQITCKIIIINNNAKVIIIIIMVVVICR